MISIFRNSKIKAAFSAFFFAVQFSSCSKFVTVDPPVTSTTGASAYTADGTAIAVLTGLYIYLSQGSFITGSGSFSLIGGLSADEWTLSNTVPSTDPMTYFYTNGLFVNTTTDVLGKGDYWGPIYSYIFICNSAIEGINSASTLTPAVKQQLLGEAKFLRAFFNFYLVNFYGDVPLALSTDYKANAILSRTDKAQVFQQIIADLKDAEGLLSPSYLDGTLLSSSTDRVRPTEWAAHALLAKVYLFSGSYDSAASQASLVINNSGLFGLDTLNAVFLKNSTEAIWQLQPVEAGWNTLDAQVFLLRGRQVIIIRFI
jgi:starch-binding outer membrane protein, SusD/RagB family